MKRLHAAGRFVHAGLSIGRGQRLLHCISFYGVSGCTSKSRMNTDYAANEAHLSSVFDLCKSLGHVPCIIGMDANASLVQSETLQEVLSSGEFVALGNATDDAGCSQNTYSASGWSNDDIGTSRIDHLIATPCAASCACAAGLNSSCYIGQHRVVQVRVRIQHFRAYEWTLKPLPKLQLAPSTQRILKGASRQD